jgi:quercetin dioxygenase-like cupin family protein
MEVSPMKVTRFHATPDGGSRFQDLEIPINQPRPDNFGFTLLQSNAWPSPNIRFVQLPAGLDQSWHHAPASQIVVVLSGALEVGTSDGEKRRCAAGQAFIADDLTGQGHLTRVLDGPAHVMFVELPPNFDFTRWAPA